jgi:hypothetical protein
MADFLILIVQEIWYIPEASIFLVFEFALVGALAALVPARTLMRCSLEESATKAADTGCDDGEAHHHERPPPDRAPISLRASTPASVAIFSTGFGRLLAVR